MSSIPDDMMVPMDQEFGGDQTERYELGERFMDGDVPWSDDLLDSGIHYLKISREMLGITDEE